MTMNTRRPSRTPLNRCRFAILLLLHLLSSFFLSLFPLGCLVRLGWLFPSHAPFTRLIFFEGAFLTFSISHTSFPPASIQEFEVTMKKMMEGNMTLVDALGGYQLVGLPITAISAIFL